MSTPTHKALPAEVQRRLKLAALTPNTERDPMARSKEIDAVMRWARREYPEYFRNEVTTNEN